MSDYQDEQGNKNVPAMVDDDTAIANIAAELQSSSGADRMKFVKGVYKKKGDVVVPLGTRFVAHVPQMQHGYVCFNEEQEKIGEHVVPMGGGQKLPDRSELSNPELEGTENDPWIFQYYLPLEEVETGDMVVFISNSVGGKIALTKLAQKVARKKRGLPTVELDVGEFSTKNFKNTPMPNFRIVDWEIKNDAILVPSGDDKPKPSLNDAIPF